MISSKDAPFFGFSPFITFYVTNGTRTALFAYSNSWEAIETIAI